MVSPNGMQSESISALTSAPPSCVGVDRTTFTVLSSLAGCFSGLIGEGSLVTT